MWEDAAQPAERELDKKIANENEMETESDTFIRNN